MRRWLVVGWVIVSGCFGAGGDRTDLTSPASSDLAQAGFPDLSPIADGSPDLAGTSDLSGEDTSAAPDLLPQPECSDGAMRPCPDVLQTGACLATHEVCVAGAWSACMGVLPSAETCNGVDDSCDGIVDDGLPTCNACLANRYGQQFIVDSKAVASVLANANEAASFLRTMTGNDFVAGTTSSSQCTAAGADRAIHVFLSKTVLDGGTGAPAAVVDALAELATRPRPTYLIHSDDDGNVWIVAPFNAELRAGIWELLYRFGARFYFPSDAWRILPSVDTLSLGAVHQFMQPSLRTIQMSGTGGWGPVTMPIADPTGPSTRWSAWLQHNSFPLAFDLDGHTGESFNDAKEPQLLADPLMMAYVGSSRRTLDVACSQTDIDNDRCTAKPNYTYHGGFCGTPSVPATCGPSEAPTWEDPDDYSTYGGLVKLYGDYRISGWTIVNSNPESPSAAYLSVEPADGRQHCECQKCRDLLRHNPYGDPIEAESSISDRVFHLANQVAARVSVVHPGRGVSLFAYNDHAMVPSIPLLPNVLVELVPYRYHFPFTGMYSDELIAAWVDKAKNNSLGKFELGIYDYWAIPDSAHDQPFSPYLARTRASSWIASGLIGVTGETSYGAAATALPWWLTDRLSWDAGFDLTAGLDEWFTLSFEAAAPMVRSFYDRMWQNPTWSPALLGLCIADLQSALAVTGLSDGAKARLDDMVAYMHYLRLSFDVNFRGSSGRPARIDPMLAFIWRIYQSGIVHTFRIHQLAFFQFDQEDPPAYATLLAKWNVVPDKDTPAGTVWADKSWTTPPTHDELTALLAADAVDYPVISYDSVVANGDYVPLYDIEYPVADNAPPDQKIRETTTYARPYDFLFVLAPTTTRSIDATGGAGSDPDVVDQRISIYDASGKSVKEVTIPMAPNSSKTVHLDLSGLPDGQYKLHHQLFDTSQKGYLTYPSEMRLAQLGEHENATNEPAKKVYFFVPKGVKKMAMKIDSTTAFTIAYDDWTTKTITPQKISPNLFLFDVPDGFDGTPFAIWGHTANALGGIRSLSGPNVWARRPYHLFVPANEKP